MRRFLLRLILFILPLLAIAAALFFYPVDRKYAYHYNPGDCENRGAWLYERIFRDTAGIDVVFFGTSHTITGIQDMRLETLLLEQTGKRLRVANLGYCRIGEELPYLLLKDVFRTKHPRIVVLEVRERISTNSQPVYPSFAETEDLICPASFAQQSYPANVYNGWLFRLSALRTDLFSRPDTVAWTNYSRFGYRYSDHAADPTELERAKQDRAHPRPVSALHDAETRYPIQWIEQLEDLAAANGAKICFLYLAAYGSPEKIPEFQQVHPGIFLLPPDSITAPPQYWRDPDHLNNTGGKMLSNWLAGELVKI